MGDSDSNTDIDTSSSARHGSNGISGVFAAVAFWGTAIFAGNYVHDNYLDKEAIEEKARQEFMRGPEFDYKRHEAEISRLNIKLGDDIAAQCKNVAEERYHLMAGENADKYQFILSQQMGCLKTEERKAEPLPEI